MPRVFRKTYTKPIPDGAAPTTIKNARGQKVPAVRFKGADGRTVTVPLTRDGTKCLMQSPTWYGRVAGKPIPLCTDKLAAEVMLADLVRDHERAGAGMVDPFIAHKKAPLSEHLADYESYLTQKGSTPYHVGQITGWLKRAFADCHFTRLADLDAAKVASWVAGLARRGDVPSLPVGKETFTTAEAGQLLGIRAASVNMAVSRFRLQPTSRGRDTILTRETVIALASRHKGAGQRTRAHYLGAVRAFGRWLVRPGKRLAADPFVDLVCPPVTQQRRMRRELQTGELQQLLGITRASVKVFRGLTGEARFHLYALACGTGFRASGLASLTPECFHLAGVGEGAIATVTLPVRSDKSRRGKVQPLPADVADLMRAYLVGKSAGQRIWDGVWASQRLGAEMLRIDLKAAGIPYAVEGPDGPLYADFHALRATYLTMGGRSGIDLRTLQELAGHSTPALTARYVKSRLHDQASAIKKIPGFLPPASEKKEKLK